jgi:hypothetical protein
VVHYPRTIRRRGANRGTVGGRAVLRIGVALADMERVTDDDARKIRAVEEQHRLVAQLLPDFADILAFDIALEGVAVAAMSKDIEADRLAAWKQRGGQGDLKTELSETVEAATLTANQVVAYESVLPDGKSVLIQQFYWRPDLAKIYYPTGPSR